MYLLLLIAIEATESYSPPELRSGRTIEEDPFSMATENSPHNNPKGGGTRNR